MKKVDLDKVLLTEEVVEAWREISARFAIFLVSSGRISSAEEVPNEQARLEDNGSLTIFVKVGGLEASMSIPPDHWSWRQ